ncbi:MAG: hypothetical protein J5X21_16555 [Candidatus Accumulibacter sp.]|nr:hypothetical protein [Candidatus Accumulibacter conexus]
MAILFLARRKRRKPEVIRSTAGKWARRTLASPLRVMSRGWHRSDGPVSSFAAVACRWLTGSPWDVQCMALLYRLECRQKWSFIVLHAIDGYRFAMPSTAA